MKPLITPHNPAWKTEFNRLKNTLEGLLQGIDFDIQHVGSTAIPGLPAKPILDIDIIIEKPKLLDEIAARLAAAGYINRGDQGIPGRFAFRQSAADTPFTETRQTWQEHHLYVCFSDSLALKNHLLFRDALLNNPDLVAEYATIKSQVANQHGITRAHYTKQKTTFILAVLASAGLEEAALQAILEANS